jgi:hypothetical protein
MLPMRFLVGTLVVLVAAAGCKNSSTGTFNPFPAAARVPPPSTRVLAPGASQPYYPGDPLPGAAPVGGLPAGAAPPATAYPGTTPPGGWGTYGPQSSTAPGGDAVRVPGDDQGLRFAAAEVAPPEPITPTPEVPPASAFTFGPAPTARMPIQGMLPLAGGGSTPEQLAAREVTPAEYLAGSGFTPGASPASAEVTRDGFRPQGSQPRATADADQSFRPPEIRGGAGEATVDTAHYGAAPNLEWLRGQLEYWPASGHWSLRYLPEGAAIDAIGGRVLIDNPQVLANLSPGELVLVQGQLFAKPNEMGGQSPAYRVAVVQRQRQ